MWICGAHTVIIACVCRDASLHTPYNYIIATCSSQDITINLACNVFALYAIVRGGGPIARVPSAMNGTPGVASFFAMCYIISVMAYERYRLARTVILFQSARKNFLHLTLQVYQKVQ